MKRPLAIISALIFAVATLAGGQAAPEAQGQALLRKIYLASARVHDLLGLIETSKWAPTAKSQFQQLVQTVQSDLDTLEKWRYQFLYHPDDANAAGKTLDAFNALIPDLERSGSETSQFGSAREAGEFKQALGEMSGLRDNLQSYLETRFPSQFPAVPPTATAATPQAEPAAPPVETPPTHPSTSAVPTAPAQPPPAAAPSEVVPPTPTAVVPPAPAVGRPAPESSPTEASATAQAPASVPGALAPDQMKSLLRNVFLTDARVNDLLSLLVPSKWTMSDSERALFNERLQSAENQLKAVEKWRYQFLYNVQKPELGESTASALGELVPQLLAIETTVAQYQGPSDASQFAQAAHQLAAARNAVSSYTAALEAENRKALEAPAPALPGGKALATEKINVPTSVAPPLSSIAVATPPLSAGQVKSILDKVYLSQFRIQDLLGQEEPEKWAGAPAAERTLAVQARAALLSRLGELEKWRELFSRNPGNMYYAFETYRAVDALFHPLRVFGREAGKYENPSMADDYSRREDDMEAQLNGLVPYISFILQHADTNLETFQTDLASCQTQLSYAMHGFVRPAEPMKNIVPVFQGRRARRTKRSHRERDDAKKPAAERTR